MASKGRSKKNNISISNVCKNLPLGHGQIAEII
jgi:hypothetical protein